MNSLPNSRFKIGDEVYYFDNEESRRTTLKHSCVTDIIYHAATDMYEYRVQGFYGRFLRNASSLYKTKEEAVESIKIIDVI